MTITIKITCPYCGKERNIPYKGTDNFLYHCKDVMGMGFGCDNFFHVKVEGILTSRSFFIIYKNNEEIKKEGDKNDL